MRSVVFLTILLVAGLCIGIPSQVSADVVSWLPDADGFWQIADNWSSHPALPGPNDHVVIDVGGTTVRTITHAVGESRVRSLFSLEDLRLTNGRLIAGDAQMLGVLTISGGTLANTTLSGSPLRVETLGTLDNVTLNSGLEFPNPFLDQLYVQNGLVLHGVTVLSAARLNFAGTQTLGGTGIINITDLGSIRILEGMGRHATLTIGSEMTIRGKGEVGSRLLGNPTTLVNQGLIDGALTVNPSVLLNQGTMQVSDGVLKITPTATFTNSGTIRATNGARVDLGVSGGSWSSSGTIVIDNASLSLAGSFQTASLSGDHLQRNGGWIGILGTLDNTEATLDIGSVILSGTIRGGTTVSPIALLSETSEPVLDGVTPEGGLSLPNGGRVRIRNGMTLNSAVDIAAPASSSVFRFEGSQALTGNSTFSFSPGSHRFLVEDGATLTIGSGIVLRGTSGHLGTVTLGQDSVVNHGTIRADVTGGMWVHSMFFDNRGTLEARNGGVLRLADVGRTVISTGTIIAGPGGTVALGGGGSFSIAGGTIILNNGMLGIGGVYATSDLQPDFFQNSGGTLALGGTLNNHNAVLDLGLIWLSGRINGGTTAGLINGGGWLDGVTINGGLNVITGVSLSGSNTLNSQVHVATPNGNIRIRGLTALGGSGEVIFSHQTTKLFIDGGSTFSIGDGLTLRGFSNLLGERTLGTSGTTAIVNAGLISADTSSGSLTFIAGSVTNSGIMEARDGGQLNIVHGLTTSGTVEAKSDGLIRLGDPVLAEGGSIGGDGSVRALGRVTFVGTVTKPGTGVLRIGGLLDLPPGNTLDLVSGSVVNDYTTSTPFNEIRNLIVSGYNNGSWNGTGINSSTAAADPSAFAVGYAEASALFTSFPATFSGETIDDTTVIVRMVRAGDADLNGRVELADFNRLAANFGSTSAVWTEADFNYDGVVGFEDFNLLAANFNLSAGADGPTPEDWANLAAAVPEPGAIGVMMALAGSAAVCLRRRVRCVRR